ncbi:hypothetical protein [Oricola sp.]|uniref:hypothetical protein n=1 Tax=Oricola sp. TaxID=1979950 RepID=UPI003BAC215D
MLIDVRKHEITAALSFRERELGEECERISRKIPVFSPQVMLSQVSMRRNAVFGDP